MSRHGKWMPGQLSTEQRREADAKLSMAAVATLAPPAKEEVQTEDPEFLAEYKALVAELGVNDSAVRNAEFRQFLSDECISVYDYGRVSEFLDKKLKAERKASDEETLQWVWKPIIKPRRPTEDEAERLLSASWFSRIFVAGSMGDGLSSLIYERPIPHAVLLTVKKIRDKFGDKVQFYASDYELPRPDPFLMVTGPGLDRYVIERWDEPTFRE